MCDLRVRCSFPCLLRLHFALEVFVVFCVCVFYASIIKHEAPQIVAMRNRNSTEKRARESHLTENQKQEKWQAHRFQDNKRARTAQFNENRSIEAFTTLKMEATKCQFGISRLRTFAEVVRLETFAWKL